MDLQKDDKNFIKKYKKTTKRNKNLKQSEVAQKLSI